MDVLDRCYASGHRKLERIGPDKRLDKTVLRQPKVEIAVNRELACLKHMFNMARKGLIELTGGVPPKHPVSAVEFRDEHNIRQGHAVLRCQVCPSPPYGGEGAGEGVAWVVDDPHPRPLPTQGKGVQGKTT